MTRVAIDFFGGDAGPEVVADAIASYLNECGDDRVSLCIVGPRDQAEQLLRQRGVNLADDTDAGRSHIMHAESCVPMTASSHDTLALLREREAVASNVGIRAVREGQADAFVSIGHTGATVAASVLSLGRLPSMGRPGLAVEIPSARGPVVLVDCGAAPFATEHDLVRFAACGLAYAEARGIKQPSVGLLSIGSERGKGDRLRKNTDIHLEQHFAERYVGAVEGHDLLGECPADVVVVDGFTGNVALKSMEGALRWSVAAMSNVYDDPEPAQGVLRTSHFLSGGVLLGVPGAVVVGHGASTRDEIVACINRAVELLDAAVVDRLRVALRDFSLLDARGEPESV
jgi:glycerol-3-phosphate acyltransferase PlsX